jgi:hypothetical protein
MAKLQKYLPISKVEEQSDGTLHVYGVVTAEQPDRDKEVCDYAKTRFCDYAEGDWSTLVLPTFKLSTRRGYRMVLGRHLLPRFGDVQLCDITKLGVPQFVGEKFRQGLKRYGTLGLYCRAFSIQRLSRVPRCESGPGD